MRTVKIVSVYLPKAVHDYIKRRAARNGISASAYLSKLLPYSHRALKRYGLPPDLPCPGHNKYQRSYSLTPDAVQAIVNYSAARQLNQSQAITELVTAYVYIKEAVSHG